MHIYVCRESTSHACNFIQACAGLRQKIMQDKICTLHDQYRRTYKIIHHQSHQNSYFFTMMTMQANVWAMLQYVYPAFPACVRSCTRAAVHINRNVHGYKLVLDRASSGQAVYRIYGLTCLSFLIKSPFSLVSLISGLRQVCLGLYNNCKYCF